MPTRVHPGAEARMRAEAITPRFATPVATPGSDASIRDHLAEVNAIFVEKFFAGIAVAFAGSLVIAPLLGVGIARVIGFLH